MLLAEPGVMLTRTESFGTRQPFRLSLRKLPFQSGLLFFYTGRQQGGISLSFIFLFKPSTV